MPETDATQDSPVPAEMRALVLSSFGGLKSIKLMNKARPTVEPGHVLIKVKSCGMNFQDLMVRQGAMVSCPKTPFVMGFECAGIVEELSEGVTQFKVGDRVVGLPEFGAWAEYVSVPVGLVFPIPDDMPFNDAAALAVNYIVAYIILFDLARVEAGNSILIHSAGGGVGMAITQLAKTLSGVQLFGIASKAKHEKLIDIDHLLERGQDYVTEIRKISAEGVDAVLDCLYGEDCNKGLSLLKPMGTYVLYGTANMITGETKSFFSAARSWWQVDKLSPIKLFEENKNLCGFNLRHLLYGQNKVEYVAKVMDRLVSLWKQGKIKPFIDSCWALDDVPEAMQKMHDRGNIGKIIIDIELEPKPKPPTPSKTKRNCDKDEKKKNDESGKEKDPDLDENKSESKEEENSS